MKRIAMVALLLVSLAAPALACGHAAKVDIVDVRIVSDNGQAFPKYQTFLNGRQDAEYYYLEAVKGQRYSVQVTNKSDRRIGVVIAVDGRNIIDAKKSDLRNNEKMYILGPYETNSFEGWRTGLERTNRFYFTELSDSYSEKVFADASAMGTIAVAVYKEKMAQIAPYTDMSFHKKEAPAAGAPSDSAKSRAENLYKEKGDRQAGTGFGETTYSPTYVVEFDPEHSVAEKIVMKYEWRSELCRRGIVSCGPKNRFWPDDNEFAPVPKDFNG